MFGLIVCVAPLLIGEILVRVFADDGPSQLVRAPLEGKINHDIQEVFRDHAQLFWELRADLDGPFGPWGDRTDGLGLRNAATPGPKDGRLRVVCLGDSCTYGFRLSLSDAWPTRLGAAANLEAINAGVPGYTSFQGVRFYDERCAALEPDVLVVGFGHNDARAWGTLQNGVLHCLSDRERAAHLSFLSISRRSALLRWIIGRTRVPPAEGVPFVANYDISTARPRVSVEEFRTNLLELAARVPRTVFIAWPRRVQLDPEFEDYVPLERYLAYRDTVLGMSDLGHAVIDLEQVYRDSGLAPDALFLDDTHPTPSAADLIARVVEEAVTRAGDDR